MTDQLHALGADATARRTRGPTQGRLVTYA